MKETGAGMEIIWWRCETMAGQQQRQSHGALRPS